MIAVSFLIAKGENTMKDTMKETIETILKKWNLLEAFEKAQGGKFHLSIKNPPFMDLVIEKVGDDQISVAHYGEQNGDAMRDPEVVFRLPDWTPLYIQQDYMGTFRETHDENGNPIPHEVASLKSFCATWAKNLRDQKFTTRGTASSMTHARLLNPEAAPDAHLEAQYEDRTGDDE